MPSGIVRDFRFATSCRLPDFNYHLLRIDCSCSLPDLPVADQMEQESISPRKAIP